MAKGSRNRVKRRLQELRATKPADESAPVPMASEVPLPAGIDISNYPGANVRENSIDGYQTGIRMTNSPGSNLDGNSITR